MRLQSAMFFVGSLASMLNVSSYKSTYKNTAVNAGTYGLQTEPGRHPEVDDQK